MRPSGRPFQALLAQLPIPPLGPQPLRGNVPLAAGYLKLLARARGLEGAAAVDIFPPTLANTLGDAALVEEIAQRKPDLLGLTCYLWNIDRSLWIAGRVRERCPGTMVLVGGPEITRDNAWVLEHPAVDLAAFGEGEQTFCELLAALCESPGSSRDDVLAGLRAIPGLLVKAGGTVVSGPPRVPIASLDDISSPYLAGILSARDGEQLLLETTRGCIFKCKFCYYPKAYDSLYFVSREKILANLAHARDAGAREVYLLDPTLNQRRDFLELLEILGQGNPDRSLEYHAEMRGEGLNVHSARLLREANFREVEIGLQSIDPVAQELMDRRNSLAAFERGVRALQAEGITTRVDLVVGLPGDTVDSVRRGIHYLAEKRLYDEIQVFQLSILPGTSFREEAGRLGLIHQAAPPYYALRTPTLEQDQMLDLLAEAEEAFDTQFDALPPPGLPTRAELEAGAGVLIDADRHHVIPNRLPARQAFTLWLRARSPYRALPALERAMVEHLEANPFATLQILLETDDEFPFDVFRRIEAAARRTQRSYLDDYYSFTPGTRAGATRIVALLPEALRSRCDPEWRLDATDHCDLVWRSQEADSPGAGAKLVPGEEPGEWKLV